jgi:hypothetical protein
MRAMRLVTNSRLAGDVLCHRDGAFSHQCAASVWQPTPWRAVQRAAFVALRASPP